MRSVYCIFFLGMLFTILPNLFSENNQIKENASHPEDMYCQEHQSFDNTFFLEADFIYWNVSQSGNDYASFGTSASISEVVTSQGQIYHPSAKMSPGFKVAAGINLYKDLWDIKACYTWIHAHNQAQTPKLTHYNTATQFPLMPFFNYGFGSTLDGTPWMATADSKIHFQSLDVELGKNSYLSHSFNLRRFAGLKGAWSKEYLNLNYISSAYDITLQNDPPSLLAVQPVSFPSADGNLQVVYTQHFWGLGPRIGTFGSWKLWNNHLEFFSEIALSLLWSQFHLIQQSLDTESNAFLLNSSGVLLGGQNGSAYSNLLIADQSYRTHSLLPVIEVVLGLQTEWLFARGARFLISAGWELQTFLFMLQHSSVIANTSFNMEGFTLKFRYDF